MLKRSSVSICSLGFLILLLVNYPTSAQTWRNLLGQADSLSKAGNLDSAVVRAKSALREAEAQFGKSDTSVASVLNILGKLYSKQARFSDAEVLLKRALKIREEVLGPDHPDVAISSYNLGTLYRIQGQYADAESLYKKALRIWIKTVGPKHPKVANGLNALGLICWTQGRYAEAELLFRRALKIQKDALGPKNPAVAVILISLGALYFDEGKYSDAEYFYKSALKIWEKALDPNDPKVAGSLNNLANVYTTQGRYTDAEPLYERALGIWEKIFGPNNPRVAISLNSLGNLYAEEGRYTEAESRWIRALNIWKETLGPEHPYVARSLFNLGGLYDVQHKYADAESSYKQALEIQIKALGAKHPDVASSLNDLGNLYAQEGKYAEAESLWNQSMRIWEETLVPYDPNVARSLYSLGTLYHLQGRNAKAGSFLRRALKIRERAFGPEHSKVASSLSALALLYRDEGGWKEAKGLGRRAYDIRRKNFRDGCEVLSEKNALLYSKFMRDEAGTYLSILFDSPDTSLDRTREIADVVFSSKGQVSDGIFARQRTFSQEGDSSLILLADSLRFARFKLAKLWVEGPDKKNPESYKSKLSEANAMKERLESELARKSSSFRRKLEIWEVDYKKIAQCLPTGTILVEYMRYNHTKPKGEGEPHYLVVVLNSKGDVFALDLGQATAIDSAVAWYRSLLHSPATMDARDYKRISKEIYQLVWKPIEKELIQSKTVFIAPDGGLNLVSFAGLIDDKGRYLIEEYPLHYLSSARDLLRLKWKPPCGSGLLALADPDYDAPPSTRLATAPARIPDTLLASVPYGVRNVRSGSKELKSIRVSRLPQTRQEIELIAKKWKKKRKEPEKVYLGAQASEETFKAEALGSRVIHLATHGYFISCNRSKNATGRGIDLSEAFVGENPLLVSGLFLAGANLHGQGADSLGCEDGILTAEEVAGMNLEGTELVVLSACETGLGEVKTGEGVYGLRRAFQMAGARTVISALWPVSDQATTELMGELYGAKRESIPQLMRKMALDRIRKLRKKKQPDIPLSWGAFIALGDWRIE